MSSEQVTSYGVTGPAGAQNVNRFTRPWNGRPRLMARVEASILWRLEALENTNKLAERTCS